MGVVLNIYNLAVGNESHSVAEVDCEVESNFGWETSPKCMFNMVMVDVSGSMNHCWNLIESHWNGIVAPSIKGFTKLYTFSTKVTFRRAEPYLRTADFDDCSTDLTGAIEIIGKEVTNCEQKLIRVFLITDGHHNETPISPESAIKNLRVSKGKTVEVYLLGVGNSFPVVYSISLRSYLHSGNSNVPSLFWAEDDEDIEIEMQNIAEMMKRGFLELKVSLPGYLCPGSSLKSKVYVGEFLYYNTLAKNLAEQLKLTRDDSKVEFAVKTCNASSHFLLEKVFRQWNSLIIQQHRTSKPIPLESYEIMKKIYETEKEKLSKELAERINSPHSLGARLTKNKLTILESRYSLLISESKTVVGLEKKKKIESEIELAKKIETITVRRKYSKCQSKQTATVSRMDAEAIKKKKGDPSLYFNEKYDKQMEDFMKIYSENKEAIQSSQIASDLDACFLTKVSPLSDLRDPVFEEFASEGLYLFLITFSLTGIPVNIVHDDHQSNPWSIDIKYMMPPPFNLVSQSVLAPQNGSDTGKREVFLQENNEASKVNAIIPVFSQSVAEILKKFLDSELFTTMTNYCTIGVSDISDSNIHLAALGSAYIKTISEYPKVNRPQFIMERIKMIEATAQLYLDRKEYATYIDALLNNTCEALMIESREMFGDSTIKCESLIKPAFFLCLLKDSVGDKEKLKNVLRLICAEFVVRCLAEYKGHFPYCDYFIPNLSAKLRCELWISQIKELEIIDGSWKDEKLLRSSTSSRDLLKSLEDFFTRHIAKFTAIGETVELSVDMERVKNLRHSDNKCLSWEVLNILADEIDLSKEDCLELLSKESIFVYLSMALEGKREQHPLNHDAATMNVRLAVTREIVDSLKKFTRAQAIEKWQSYNPDKLASSDSEVEESKLHKQVQQNIRQKSFLIVGNISNQNLDEFSEEWDQQYEANNEH